MAAFQTLRALASEPVELGEALSRSRDPLVDSRDRALVTDLVTGTLRWRGALDYQLQARSAKPLHRLDPEVLDALRLGAYQVLHLERIPIRAAVHDAVNLVRMAGVGSASGFANAVLRRLARERDTLSWPPRPDTLRSDADRRALVEHLSVVHSHAGWLVDRWLTRYGLAETEAWLAFNNRPATLTLAANRLRTTRDALAARLRSEGLEAMPTAIAPYGLTVDEARVLTSQAFRGGDCVVQDEASQIVPEIVRAAPGHRVLDLCASPGGKTLALAAQCGASRVVATDVRPRRVRLLAETLRRCGASAVHLVHVAPDGVLPFADGSFDRVLVDAPCSGLGTVRRDPDIRWRRTESDLPLLARAQRALLERVHRVVAPGGRLIYSTCSSEPEENEQVIASTIGAHPDLRVLPLATLEDLPAGVATMATSDGYLRTTPRHGLEAFFGAVLERAPG